MPFHSRLPPCSKLERVSIWIPWPESLSTISLNGFHSMPITTARPSGEGLKVPVNRHAGAGLAAEPFFGVADAAAGFASAGMAISRLSTDIRMRTVP